MPAQTTALQSQITTDTLRHIERELLRDPRLQSANSRRGYLTDLKGFETWRGARPMTKLLVEEYASHLLSLSRSPNSINRALAAVRWWARRVADLAYEGELPKAQRDEIVTQAARVATIEDVTGERAPKGRHVAQDELQALLRACLADNTPAGLRDAAIITVAWSTGLRRSELAGLRLDSWKRNSLGQPIEVIGKGNKRRAVYLHADAIPWLNKWLVVRGSAAGPMFCPVRKGGHVAPAKGVTDEALAQMLNKRQLQAAVPEPVTWHDFRRTFAGNLLDRGVDLVTVQKLLGHSSPTTTSNYDRRGEETKQRAIQSLQLPLWTEAK